MKTQPEILLGRIAVEAGKLTEEQLVECLREQDAAASGQAPPLGSILLRRGLLRREDLDVLLAEQQKRLSDALDLSDPAIEDAVLGRLLVRQGLATESQVFECLRAQAEMGGAAPRLGEMLVQRNYIASDAVDTAILLRKKEVFLCPSCRAQYSTLGADPGKKYTCRKCGCVLEREERVFRPGETTGTLRVDMPEDAATHAKDPERRFAGGKYVLIDEVGRGGMGIVWKAWQTDLRRYVAIKLLAGAGWTDQDLRRFHREAQMAAALSHSNIASIFEVGSDAGRHFIAMEFVDGETLSAIVVPPALAERSEAGAKAPRRSAKGAEAGHDPAISGVTSPPSSGPRHGTQRRVVGLRRAVEIVRDAALAVDYAHSKGIIHRDIKPSNIMVTRQGGRTYVMDFGLARPVRDQETVTVSEVIVGTPSYMAPEQARGGPLDRRADVYGLGAVLYAVTTGRPPFSGRSAADTLMKVLADDPVPPRRLNPRVHEDLETICLKALDRDRHRRYDSARTFADDLTRYLEGEPIGARPLSWRERSWKFVRRRPAASVLVAGGTMAALLLLLTVLAMGWRTSGRVDAFLRDGDERFTREEYEEALRSYDRALALDPEHSGAHQRRQLCERAVEGRRRGVDARVAALRELADALFEGRAYEGALAHYRKILDLSPGNEWALDRRKLCETRIEKTRAEEKAREDAAAQSRALVEQERRRTERRERALPHYESGRAAASRSRGRAPGLREAAEALGRAVREDDSYAEAWHLRGCVRFRLSEFAGAELDFLAALRAAPSFAAAAFQLAVLHEVRYQLHSRSPYVKGAEEVKAALAGQQKAVGLVLAGTAPAFERWGCKALSQLRARRFDDAIGALERVRAEGGGRYEHALLRAVVHMESGDEVQALAALASAVEVEPFSFEALFLRALLRDRRDDLDGALEDAEAAVGVAPELYLGYLLRAHVHHRRGDLRKSRGDLETAAKLPGAPAEQIQEALASMRESPDR